MYNKDSIKEFILGSIQSKILVNDCIEIIYSKIKENILLTYKTIDNIINLNASYYELTILYNNGFNINGKHLNRFTLNNYLTGVIFIINNIEITDYTIDSNILIWLTDSCNNNNLDMLKIFYNKFNNYIPDYWTSHIIYPIIRNENKEILNWLKEQNVKNIFLNNTDYIIYKNDYELIEKACSLNIEIIGNPIYLLSKASNYNFTKMMDIIYDNLIKDKYDNEFNDLVRDNKNIYKWVKNKRNCSL